MKCDEFENQLQEVLDRRESLADDPFLGRHASSCTACRRKIQLYEALFDGLELAETPALTADFSSQITRTATVGRPTRWKPVVAICVTLAASLLVMVAIANRNGSGSNDPRVQDPVAEGDTTPSASPPNELSPLPPQVASLPEEHPVPSRELDFFPDWQLPPQGNLIAETSAATTRLPGFRPLASSLTTAFSAIRQTLPGSRNEVDQPSKPQAGFQRPLDSRHA